MPIFPALFLGKSQLVSGKQAQQSHRFILRIRGIDSALIQDVTTPKYSIETATYDLLEHEYHYPKKLKWKGPIDFTVIQILDNDVFASSLGYMVSKVIDARFYASPVGIGNPKSKFLPDLPVGSGVFAGIKGILGGKVTKFGPNKGTVFDLSKEKLMASLGTVEIKTLDEDGRIYEGWKLGNAFVTTVTPTDFKYENETVSTVKVSISYDWAQYGFKGVYAEENAVTTLQGLAKSVGF
jgi:hypothetical protein